MKRNLFRTGRIPQMGDGSPCFTEEIDSYWDLVKNQLRHFAYQLSWKHSLSWRLPRLFFSILEKLGFVQCVNCKKLRRKSKMDPKSKSWCQHCCRIVDRHMEKAFEFSERDEKVYDLVFKSFSYKMSHNPGFPKG